MQEPEIKLSDRDFELLKQMLEQDIEPTDAAKDAAEKYKQLKDNDKEKKDQGVG